MAKLMSNQNLPQISSREVASLVKGRDIADTLRVLKDLPEIELVGPRQIAGDYVSWLICKRVDTCNHRRDDPGREIDVGAGAGKKRSRDGMDLSG